MSDVNDNDLTRFVQTETIVQRVRQLLADVPSDRMAAAWEFIEEGLENERLCRDAAYRAKAEGDRIMAKHDAFVAALKGETVLHDKGTDRLLAAVFADPNVSPAFKSACGCKAHGAKAEVEFKPRPGEEPERFSEIDGPMD